MPTEAIVACTLRCGEDRHKSKVGLEVNRAKLRSSGLQRTEQPVQAVLCDRAVCERLLQPTPTLELEDACTPFPLFAPDRRGARAGTREVRQPPSSRPAPRGSPVARDSHGTAFLLALPMT